MSYQSTPKDSPEAAQAVLGSILIRPESFPEIAAIIKSSDLCPPNGPIFQAMQELHDRNEPIDLVTVAEHLREQGKLGLVGGAVYLAALSEKVGFATNGPYYARIVRKRSKIRQLAGKAQAIVKLCEGQIKNAADILQHAESQILEITQESFEADKIIPASMLLTKRYLKDEIIGAGILPKGGGLILAGESGEGKSIIRLELAIHIAMGWNLWGLEIRGAHKVLINQFENTEAIEAFRLKSMLAGHEITNFPDNLIFSDQTMRLDLGKRQDRGRLMRLIDKSGAEVIVYDPLTSLHCVNENDNVQIRKILDNITEINRKTGTAAMVIHHFGKPTENSNIAHRTRGASSIRDWCDTLIAITRKKNEHKILRLLEFIKVRNGPEPKPLLLERDKGTFLHHLTDDDMACPPEKVKAILETLGGRVEGQDSLKQAIMDASHCDERRARYFIKLAVERGFIWEKKDPQDKRKKIYGIGK